MAKIKDLNYKSEYDDKTVSAIREEIKESVRKINERISGSVEAGIIDWNSEEGQDLSNLIQNTNSYIGNQRVYKNKLQSGATLKTKSELIRYARELKAFEKNEYWTIEGQSKINKQYEKAMATFIEDNPEFSDMTDSEYRSMVENFGSVSSELMEKYGSDQVVEMLKSASKENKTKFGRIMREIEADVRKKQRQGIPNPYTKSGEYNKTYYRRELRKRLI